MCLHDALNSPVLYKGATAVVPIEGVYGIIEVKSRLAKADLVEDIEKMKPLRALLRATSA